MKKLFSVLLALALVFSLAGCSGENPSSGVSPSTEPPVSSAESPFSPSQAPDFPEAPASDAPSQPEVTGQTGKTLVAYFSWSGNTEELAQVIARQTGGDLFAIETAQPYTDDYNTLLDIAQQEQRDGARPELAAQVENWDSYQTIFVGYPNWWSDAPMAVYTFLESYDFTGKTLIPFNTSGGGGFGRSLSGIEEKAAGAEILEGLALTEGELADAENTVAQWLGGLGWQG